MRIKIIYLLIVLSSLISLNSSSQILLEGIVLFEETGLPVKSASVFLKKNQTRVVTSQDGRFSIKMNESRYSIDTLVIRSLDIEEKKIPISLAKSNFLNISVSEKIHIIDEVSIIAYTKSTPEALDILKKVIKNKRKNYISKDCYFEGFYRELLHENSKAIRLNECTFELKYTGYNDPGSRRKSFNNYWDDYWEYSKYKPRYPLSYFAQHWPLFISYSNSLEIIESRVSLDIPPSVPEFKAIGDPLGGPIDLLSMDNLKFEFHFFDKKNEPQYIFYVDGNRKINDSLDCYVVKFYPKNNQNCYIHNWSKNVKSAFYSGELLIDKKSYAVVKFTAESKDWVKSTSNCDEENAKIGWNRGYIPNKITYTVEYQQLLEGWALKEVIYNAYHNLQNDVYEWSRTLLMEEINSLTTDLQSKDLFIKAESIRYKNTSYNPSYWDAFQSSDLYIPLHTETKEQLECSSTLENQFMFINKDIKDIPCPTIDTTFIEQYAENKESIPLDSMLHIHNNYSSLIIQKLSENENYFVSKARQIIDPISQRNYYNSQNYDLAQKTEIDSIGELFFWEQTNDSTYEKVFNISAFKNSIKGVNIESIDFKGNYLFISAKSINSPYKELYIYDKILGEIIKKISHIGNYIILGDALIYTKTTTNNFRSYQCLFWQPSVEEKVLIKENNVQYEIEIQKSRSNKYTFVYVNSIENNSVYLFNNHDFSFNPLLPNNNSGINTCDHFNNDNYFIVKNYDSISSLKSIDFSGKIKRNLYLTDKTIEEFIILNDQLIFIDYWCFNRRVLAIDLTTLEISILYENKNEPMSLFIDKDISTKNELFIEVESLTLPKKLLKIDLESTKFTIVKQLDFSSQIDKNFTSEVLFASTDVDTKIPILISYNTNAVKDSVKGLIIEVYGAYGSHDLSLFDEEKSVYMLDGFIVARVGVRGSGVLGYNWHNMGKNLTKKNSINDFVISTKYLQEKFKVPPSKTFAKGVSAAGIIMGNLINNYSDLYECIILDRCFLDVYNIMNNPNLPSVTLEYKEWGNPSNTIEKENIRLISPLQNIPDSIACHLFFRASYLDYLAPINQIYDYYNKSKLASKDNIILMRVDFNHGHNIPANFKRTAEEYSIINYLLNH